MALAPTKPDHTQVYNLWVIYTHMSAKGRVPNGSAHLMTATLMAISHYLNIHKDAVHRIEQETELGGRCILFSSRCGVDTVHAVERVLHNVEAV